MFNLLREQELGLQPHHHELVCGFITKNLAGGLSKIKITEEKIDAFAVQGVFLALLSETSLSLWDHTRGVLLWSKYLDEDSLVSETLEFVGKALIFAGWKAESYALQIFNLEGTQTGCHILSQGPFSRRIIDNFILYENSRNQGNDSPLCIGRAKFFETDGFKCSLNRNILRMSNKRTGVEKSIKLSKEKTEFKYRHLFDTFYVFYQFQILPAPRSPALIVDLNQGEIIQFDAFPKSGPINDLLHHEGWTYVADRVGSLAAYHLNGTFIPLDNNNENKSYDCITTLSVSDDFLLSHREQFFQGATISIWSTLTKNYLGSVTSANGCAKLINGRIFSGTTHGFEVFDLHKCINPTQGS